GRNGHDENAIRLATGAKELARSDRLYGLPETHVVREQRSSGRSEVGEPARLIRKERLRQEVASEPLFGEGALHGAPSVKHPSSFFNPRPSQRGCVDNAHSVFSQTR